MKREVFICSSNTHPHGAYVRQRHPRHFQAFGPIRTSSLFGRAIRRQRLRDEYVAQLADQVLKKDGKRILQYGATEGYPPLFESIAQFVRTAGIQVDPSQVLPVTGSRRQWTFSASAWIDRATYSGGDPTFLGAMH